MSLPGMLRRAQAVDRARWVWRTPLERTQPFWDGWCRWPRAQRVCCLASLTLFQASSSSWVLALVDTAVIDLHKVYN